MTNETGRTNQLRAAEPLGSQYDWLARLGGEHGLRGLKVTIHIDDHAFKHIEGAIKEDGHAVVLDEDAAATDRAARIANIHDFVVAELPDGYGSCSSRGSDPLSAWLLKSARLSTSGILRNDPSVRRVYGHQPQGHQVQRCCRYSAVRLKRRWYETVGRP